MELVSHLDYADACNDVWAYVDSSGTEYAIIGTRAATSIVSLNDPGNPFQVASVSGANSVWRDIKTHENYAYVVADQGGDGLLIIDLSTLPDSVTHKFWKPDITINGITTQLNTCHNLYLDNGYIYLSGCNISRRGVIILDVNTDPLNPVVLGAADINYSHDAFVRDNILFTSEIRNGQLGIYDVSDKTNPVPLAFQRTSSAFTHNAWSNDDNSVIFTTDERANAFVDAYDITDLDQITKIGNYQVIASKNRGAIPHNTHFHNGFLVTSWYTDGIIITDAHRPENLIRVGQYDTWPAQDGGFNGCWGAYPFLPSGLVLASDISTGLYVISPDYKRASYLEGFAYDQDSELPINAVTISILSDDPNEATTDALGVYRTGQVTAGSFFAVASHPQYMSDTVEILLESGDVTIQDFLLEPLSKNSISTIVIDAVTGEPISDAQILLLTVDEDILGTSDLNGQYQTEVFSGLVTIFIGKLGYKTIALEFDSDSDQLVEVALEKGIMDDFTFDFGWTVEGTSSTGQWIRDIPNGTSFGSAHSNPNEDLPDDLGNYAYITGNSNSESPGFDDVDDGQTTLTSPIFDLSDINNPEIEYALWFYNGGGSGSTPNDVMEVVLSDGIKSIVVEEVRDTSSASGRWKEKSKIIVKDHFEILESIQISIRISDDDPGHFVEGGFDGFAINEGATTPTKEEILESLVEVSPMPFRDNLLISSKKIIAKYSIYDVQGRLIQRFHANNLFKINIDTKGLIPSVYFLDILLDSGEKISKTVVKHGN